MASELKACPNPWCKENAPLVKVDRVRGEHYGVCGSCGLYGPYRRTEVDAIAAWNTRPAEQMLVEALRGLMQNNTAANMLRAQAALRAAEGK